MRRHQKMICADSRSNRVSSTKAHYTISFKKTYNVVGIDLITAEIPETTVDDFYVFVGFETFGSMESNEGVHDIFAKVVVDGREARYTRVSTIGKSFDDSSPLSSLSSLRVWIKQRDGTLCVFDDDKHNSFTLMITYLA